LRIRRLASHLDIPPWTIKIHCQGVHSKGSASARYLTELLDIFEDEGVDTALWFTFAGYSRPGKQDFGSYGVVRMLDERRWEPKKVFHTMAARYQRS
ncbi:hypothetical protein ACFTWS_40790, partial [Streptomyces sp. NPDC057027]